MVLILIAFGTRTTTLLSPVFHLFIPQFASGTQARVESIIDCGFRGGYYVSYLGVEVYRCTVHVCER